MFKKALRSTVAIAKTTIVTSLAIALFLGHNSYNLGAAFRTWCDRFIETSQKVQITGDAMLALEANKDSELDWEREAIVRSANQHQQMAACHRYEDYTIRELKKIASTAKIKGYSKMNKAKLIEALM